MKIDNSKPTTEETGRRSPTRQRILAAARAEFAQYGQAGARVDRIAATAGVNKAMIYYHFSSKANLYVEVIKSHFAEAGEKIRRLLPGTGSIEQLLLAVAKSYVELFARAEEFRAIILRELACPRAEFLEQIARALEETGVPRKLLDALQHGIDDGSLRPVDPKQALISFVNMNLGYFILAPFQDRLIGITDHDRFVEERKRAVVDIFLNGLKAR